MTHAFVACFTLLTTTLFPTSCRSSFDADAFIANTLDGRAGEIRTMLRDDLSAHDKIALADYFARIEPLAAEAKGLLGETQALEFTVRGTAGEQSSEQRALATRWRRLGDDLERVAAPVVPAPSHAEVVRGFAGLATANEAYATAIDAKDFDQLKSAGQLRRASLDAARAALDDLETQTTHYLSPGKRLRLR